MTLTNPTPVVTQLSTQLQACASWTGGTNVWYPFAPDGTAGEFAVIEDGDSRRTTYAEGAVPLLSGECAITIWKATDIGTLEAYGRTILRELMSQFTGLYFRDGTVGLCSDLGRAKEAAGETQRGIVLRLTHGLNA